MDEYKHRYESEIRETLENGCIGFLAELQEEQELKVKGFPSGDHLSINLMPLSQPNATSIQSIKNVETVFGVRRCYNQETDESSISIWDKQQKRVIINQSVIDQGLSVGPLPEFAIVDFAGHNLFWWGSWQGVDDVLYAEQDARTQVKDMQQDGDNVRSAQKRRTFAEQTVALGFRCGSHSNRHEGCKPSERSLKGLRDGWV